jgi:hypothetical protein
MNKLNEARIDIAINAGAMIDGNQISVSDSRDLVEFIDDLAKDFERHFKPDGDSLEVDEFAQRKLLARYGAEMKRQDRCEFRLFCVAATDSQLANIYKKEIDAKRKAYAMIAGKEMKRRGL